MNQLQIDLTYLKPPNDAYNIKHEDSYIISGKQPKLKRKIYENVSYIEFEEQKIQEFKQDLEKNPEGIVLSPDWKYSDYLRMIQCGSYKVKESRKCLIQHLEWKKNTKNHTLHSLNYPKNGIMYVNGRDKQYRPIVIFNAYLVDIKQDTIIQGVSYLLGNVCKHMMIPYHVENWVMIIDTNKMGIFSLPISALKSIINDMQINFCGRLDKMYILNPSSGLSFSWNTISGFIDPDTASKINFISSKEFNKLQERIDPNQLEQKYGGLLQNITNYWYN